MRSFSLFSGESAPLNIVMGLEILLVLLLTPGISSGSFNSSSTIGSVSVNI